MTAITILITGPTEENKIKLKELLSFIHKNKLRKLNKIMKYLPYIKKRSNFLKNSTIPNTFCKQFMKNELFLSNNISLINLICQMITGSNNSDIF